MNDLIELSVLEVEMLATLMNPQPVVEADPEDVCLLWTEFN